MRAGIMVALAALAATAGAAGRPPRSLVARMQDAREGFTVPAKEMRWEEEAAAAAADWPFDVARIERMLERGLVRDADYGAQIALTILLPQPEEAAFRKALQELSAGSLAPETTGTELRGVRIR